MEQLDEVVTDMSTEQIMEAAPHFRILKTYKSTSK